MDEIRFGGYDYKNKISYYNGVLPAKFVKVLSDEGREDESGQLESATSMRLGEYLRMNAMLIGEIDL